MTTSKKTEIKMTISRHTGYVHNNIASHSTMKNMLGPPNGGPPNPTMKWRQNTYTEWKPIYIVKYTH